MLPPLPLAEVLENLKRLHAACNGTHVCELPPRLQRFDLYHGWLVPKRAYKRRNGQPDKQ